MKNIFYFFAVLLLCSYTIPAQSGPDTIQVITGWNLIGSLNTGFIPSILSTEPPGIILGSVYGYNPGSGYQAADTLKRGKGYWVKVSQNGKIIFLAAPQPPALLSPPSGATNVSLPPTLTWNISNGATSYTLQVSTNDQFTNLVYNQSGLTGTSQEISGLINTTIYYWRVNATNSYRTSGWSEIWNFTTVSGGGMGDPCPGIPTVYYEGKTYNTVQIGNQCWLKENLDVGTMIQGTQNATNNGVIEKYCYDNDPNNCNIYGGFYQWDEAKHYVTTPGVQGICPVGWHIPTYAEFEILKATVGNNGNSLKAVGQGSGGGAGTNTSGFSALLAGGRYAGPNFQYLGYYARFWSSTEGDATRAFFLGLDASGSYIFLGNVAWKVYGFSVRCLKD